MNLLKNIPYRKENPGKRKIVGEKHLLIMQIALRPGQKVPKHSANSNVHLIVLRGEITVKLDGGDNRIREGDILPVAYKTGMSIENVSETDSTFLVLKTPSPGEIT